MRTGLAAILALFSTVALPAIGAPEYTLTDLGTLPGKDHIEATAINDAGQITGFAGVDYIFAPIQSHPFLYQNGKMTDLGLAPDFALGASTCINARGEVGGQMERLGMDRIDANGKEHGGTELLDPKWNCLSTFVYNGAMSIVPPPPGANGSGVDGMNSSGICAGYIEIQDNLDRRPAVLIGHRWFRIPIPKGFNGGEVGAINDSDWIALTAEVYPSGNSRAYAIRLLNPSSSTPRFEPIIDLGSIGKGDVEAYAIDKAGDIVGYAGTKSVDEHGNVKTHGFLWSKARGMVDLGSLGGTYCEAMSINDHGEIVGELQLPGKPTNDPDPNVALAYLNPHACLWKNGRLYDLNTLIPKGSGLLLARATGINNRGVIVGWAIYGAHKVHAFELTPARPQ